MPPGSAAALNGDTGALIDYLVESAPDHELFRKAIDQARTRYVPGLVLAEVDYFLRDAKKARRVPPTIPATSLVIMFSSPCWCREDPASLAAVGVRRNPSGNDVSHRVLNAQEGFVDMLVEPALSPGGYGASRCRFDQGRRLLQRLQGFLEPRVIGAHESTAETHSHNQRRYQDDGWNGSSMRVTGQLRCVQSYASSY